MRFGSWPLVAGLAWVCAPERVYAATIEVMPGESIQAAIDQAVPGDTIEVAPGTYPEALEIFYKAGSPQSWLTIRGAQSWDEQLPVIEPPDPSSPDKGITVWQSSYVRIEGLEIRNFHFNDGVRIMAGTGFELLGCDIHHNADDPSGAGLPGSEHLGSGVAVDDDTFEVVIARNRIYENGASTDFDHGMYLRGTAARVVNNIVYANTGFQIQVYPHAEQFVVANNVVAFAPVKSGIILYSNENHDNHVFNNLGWQNAQHTISVGGGAFDNLVQNNMGFGDGDGVVNGDAANTYVDNVDADPLFAGAAAYDFALTEGSPAIGAGLLSDAPTDDFYGRPRPEGGPISLGAIEFLTEPPGGTGGETSASSDGSGPSDSTSADDGSPTTSVTSTGSGMPSTDDGSSSATGRSNDGATGCACAGANRKTVPASTMLWMILCGLAVRRGRRQPGPR